MSARRRDGHLRFLDHTADVLAECEAPDFAGLLEVAARALYETALETYRGGAAPDARRMARIEGGSYEEILVRWLQELLYLLDVERFVAIRFRFDEASGARLRAVVDGYVHGPDERAVEVKAATYHGMEVRRDAEGFRARVVFDL